MAISNTGQIGKPGGLSLAKLRMPAEARIFAVLLGVAAIF